MQPLEASHAVTRDTALYAQRAMEIARGQIGGIFQTGLMMYFFVGNQLSLFNIIILMSFGFGPIKNLVALEQSKYADVYE